MKQLVSFILVFTFFMFSTSKAFAAPNYDSKSPSKTDISIMAGQLLTQEQASQLESEIIVLNNYVDTSIIQGINLTSSGNEYILDYNGVIETVILEKEDNNSVTIISSDGENKM